MSYTRLSGFDYQVWDWSKTTKRGKWETEIFQPIFDYCIAGDDCKYAKEHEYAFDGQVFYKKATIPTNNTIVRSKE